MSKLERAGAILEIDLAAVVANWRFLCAMHPSGAVAGVVKADGYGLGAAPVAQALYAAGCRHFFVAWLDEAIALRALVPEAMVAVLGGLLPGTAGDYLDFDVVPVLGSLSEIETWSASARAVGRKLPTILHIDSGMSRLGLDARELAVLQQDHARLSNLDLRYIMTHLVSSEIKDDPLNELQRQRFELACGRLPKAARSVLNSSGMFLRPRFAFDLARPGAALYGINPTPCDDANPMKVPVRLRARVLAVREVGEHQTVGYNATWRTASPRRIATAGIGYADGLHRSLSNRGRAFFDGKPVPLVGRISMDLTTFDVTEAPGVVPGAQL
ncbi:MAG TPA: alanine racemase, partial [Acetobacteraceae bacterium]|nr:alanine racemase [Acetobacteraceae bacterium]